MWTKLNKKISTFREKIINDIYSLEEDGVYKDFDLTVGIATEWITGYVLNALPKKIKARKSESYLLKSSRIQGGWGFNSNVVADADSTAIVIAGMSIENVKNKDIDFLEQHIRESGGVSTYIERDLLLAFNDNNKYFPKAPLNIYRGWLQEHLSTSCNTLIALKSVLSDKKKGKMETFIMNNFSDGVWWDYWWKDWYYPTMVAVLALEGDISNYYKHKIISYISETQLINGGWGKKEFEPFATSCIMITLKTLGYEQSILYTDAIESFINNSDYRVNLSGRARMKVPSADELSHFKGTIVKDNGIFTLATMYNALNY